MNGNDHKNRCGFFCRCADFIFIMKIIRHRGNPSKHLHTAEFLSIQKKNLRKVVWSTKLFVEILV